MFKSPINPYPGFTKTQTPLQYSPNHPAPWWLTMRSKKLRFSTARNQWHKWDEFRQNIPATKWSDQWLGTVLSYGTALETSSLRLKIDGRKTILCFWSRAYFQVYVSFSKCKNWFGNGVHSHDTPVAITIFLSNNRSPDPGKNPT